MKGQHWQSQPVFTYTQERWGCDPIRGLGFEKPHLSVSQASSIALTAPPPNPRPAFFWRRAWAGMREEMDKRSLFSAMRPSGPMEGGERLAVPKPGPGTRRAAGKWPGGGRHHGRAPCPRRLHPTFLLFECDTSFTGSAGSVTLSPNPLHQFSPPHSPAPKGQLPRGTTAWLGEQPPRSGASGPLWLL